MRTLLTSACLHQKKEQRLLNTSVLFVVDFTFVSAVVPVRRPFNCCKSVARFCTEEYGFNRDIKAMFFNGFFFTLRRACRLLNNGLYRDDILSVRTYIGARRTL
jgi:hypothetical protein